jgi:hypothetical protein
MRVAVVVRDLRYVAIVILALDIGFHIESLNHYSA